MVSDNFVLKGGKYAGKTYGEIRIINPSYLEWAHKNASNLLKDRSHKIKPSEPVPLKHPEIKEKISVLQPNMDFLNQKD